MTQYIQSIAQQTMYDLCLMTYGSLDLLVNFCLDNGIMDANYAPDKPQVFQYESDLVIGNKTVYVYTTAPIAQNISDNGFDSGFGSGFS